MIGWCGWPILKMLLNFIFVSENHITVVAVSPQPPLEVAPNGKLLCRIFNFAQVSKRRVRAFAFSFVFLPPPCTPYFQCQTKTDEHTQLAEPRQVRFMLNIYFHRVFGFLRLFHNTTKLLFAVEKFGKLDENPITTKILGIK